MRKQQLLDTVLGRPNRHNDELLYTCPKCNHHKNKLSVNLTKGVFKCWVCEFSGKNIGYLIKKYGTHNQYIEWASLSSSYSNLSPSTPLQEKLTLPEEFISLCTSSHRSIHKPAMNYLKKRGLEISDVYKWKMGFCYEGKYKNRIIVPSFDIEGELNYFIARSFIKNKIKYLNPRSSKDITFNELMVNWAAPITLVEGVFDAMKLENSIPLLGSTLPIGGSLFKQVICKKPVVYIGLDSDAQLKEEKIIKNLLLYGITVYKMQVPHGHDVGSLSKEQCKFIKQKASFVDGTDYLLYHKIFSEALT